MGKRAIIGVVAALASTAGGAHQTRADKAAPPPSPRFTASGATVTIAGTSKRALIVHATREKALLGIVVQDNPEAGTRTLLDYLRLTPSAEVALSGGFLASFYPPLPSGFVKTHGETINLPAHDQLLEGMLCVDPKSARTHIGRLSLANAREYPDCLQTGPLLVAEGHAVHDLEARHYPRAFAGRTQRAFVAIRRRGDLVLGIVEDTDLQELADFLATPEGSGGLGVSAAINLSGGGSAGLIVRGGSSFGNTALLLPNAIVLISRER